MLSRIIVNRKSQIVNSICLLLLTLLLTACSENTPEAGPSISSRSETISVSASGNEAATLLLESPVGEMIVSGTGGGTAWLAGGIEYNSEALKPSVEGANTKNIKVRQDPKGQKLPNPVINKWSMRLGNQNPADLSLVVSNGNIIFTAGETNLTKLSGKTSNGNLMVTFDKPQNNLAEVNLNSANGTIIVNGLVNAAPGQLNVKAGSGGITLDFAGDSTLRRSFSGIAEIGNGDINLTLPAGVGAKIDCTVTTGSCNASGFTRQGNTNTYLNADFPKGGNVITLKVAISNGNLKIATK